MKGSARKLSKRLSYVLRHRPDSIGLVLGESGWANVADVLGKLRVQLDELREVVESNDKQRFEFSEDGYQIRARQGHSVDVNLGYDAVTPPAILLHGTATRNIESIRKKGLHKAGRHHVHMSTDSKLMLEVGRRHGNAVLVKIDAEQMHADGHEFYLTENDVWLTESVPPQYLLWNQKDES